MLSLSRLCIGSVTALVTLTTGCAAERSAFSFHEMDFPTSAAAPRGARDVRVNVRCDGDGGLHVQAPRDAWVKAVAGTDAAAEIVIGREPDPRPIRRTRSLGFIGDNKLTPSHGGRAYDPNDALLPPHSHRSFYGGSYGSRSYGRSAYARGWSSYAPHYARVPLR